MNQTTFSLLHSLLNKLKNGIYCIVLFVENLWLKLSYVLLFFCPVDRKILNAKPFPEIGDDFGDCIDDMCDFIADNELNILNNKKNTLAAS